jgi:hypothetical protein
MWMILASGLYRKHLGRIVQASDIMVATADMSCRILSSVQLLPLMERTIGRRAVKMGIIDGRVATDHPELVRQEIRGIAAGVEGTC